MVCTLYLVGETWPWLLVSSCLLFSAGSHGCIFCISLAVSTSPRNLVLVFILLSVSCSFCGFTSSSNTTNDCLNILLPLDGVRQFKRIKYMPIKRSSTSTCPCLHWHVWLKLCWTPTTEKPQQMVGEANPFLVGKTSKEKWLWWRCPQFLINEGCLNPRLIPATTRG